MVTDKMITAFLLLAFRLLVLTDASPLLVTRNASLGDATFDPMTATLTQTFSTKARVSEDRKRPDYISMATTQDGTRLLVVDDANRRVKVIVTSSGTPRVTSSVKLSKQLWGVAVLPDGVVAVTTYEADNYIYLLRLQGDVITYTSRFQASKDYDGIAPGLDNGTLLLTSGKSLDVMSLDGQVLQSHYVSDFRKPDYLCRAGGDDVIVSDWARGRGSLYRVNARTGEVKDTYTHEDMETPHQAAVDSAGNLYVASRGSSRLMVRSPQNQWRTLQYKYDWSPTALAVTGNDVIVSWSYLYFTADWDLISFSDIKGYSLN